VISLDYAEPMERVYRRLRTHPWLGDATLALLLLSVSVGAFADHTAVIPVAGALAGAVMLRRRFPVAALAATLAIGTAQVIVGITPATTGSPLQLTFADTGILVLLYTVAATRPRPVSLAGLAACVVLFAVAVTRLNPGSVLAERPVEYVAALMTYALMPVCAWVLGNSMAHRRAYLAGLEERAVRAEAERDAQAQIAAAAERARIARELHDVIAHNLSVMVAQADGGRYAFDAEPARSRQALAEIGDTGRQALAEMSQLLGVLKVGEEAPAFAPAPGVAEIATLVAQAREAGTSVSYAVQGAARPVPAGVSLTLYRIAQEALTNVRKHAGPGATAVITLRYERGEALLTVADDGGAVSAPSGPVAGGQVAGRPVASGPVAGGRVAGGPVAGGPPRYVAGTSVMKNGLAGMRERVGLYGGKLAAGPRACGGFEVIARLPLPGLTAVSGGA
jgi:signal transduction histidine kinase